MEERADAGLDRIRADLFRRRFGEHGDDEAVVVGSRRFELKTLQQRMIVVAVKQEGHVGRGVAADFEDVERDLRRARREQPRGERKQNAPREKFASRNRNVAPDEEQTDCQRSQRDGEMTETKSPANSAARIP